MVEGDVIEGDVEAGAELIHELRQRALVMLSRREYSRAELVQRLKRIEGAAPLLPALLDLLQEQGLQSDLRYAEMLLRTRISRGQGPQRIVQEWRLKGVDKQLQEALLDGCEQDWFELARTVRVQRFGLALPCNLRAQAKQWRFLTYRGFTQEQLRYAMQPPEPE
ncbi:MAG: regulatory protein [Motiliproteus sp.]|jgi:regulatory protein